MLSDPIADMLTRIKNGYLAHKKEVQAPFSKIKAEIARVLVKEGYLALVKKTQQLGKKNLILELKYQNGQPSLRKIKRVSKPSLRVYLGTRKLPKAFRGMGISIVSTSFGVMSNKEAKQKKLGGEIICQVW